MAETPLLAAAFAVLFLTALACGTSPGSRSIVVCAYLVRVAMCYIHAYVVVLPDSQFDAIRFESVAWSWARDQQCIDDFTTGSLLYSWIGSCVYTLFGRTALLLQLINAFFGTLIVLISMRTVRLWTRQSRAPRFVGWMLALHPTLVLYSAITMREVAVVLAFSMSIYSLVRWRTGGIYINGVWAVTWMIVSQFFHTGMLTGTVLVMSVFLYFTANDHWRGLWSLRVTIRDTKVRLMSIVVVAVFVIAGSVMVSGGYGLEKIQRLATEGVLEALSEWQEQVARGRAGYLLSLKADSIAALALQTPLRVMYFVGAPFFWTISRLRDIWGSIDGMFMLIIFWAVIRLSWNSAAKRAGFRTVALVVVLMIVGFAMVTSNYGTAFRHRGKFVPALIALYGCGINRYRRELGAVAAAGNGLRDGGNLRSASASAKCVSASTIHIGQGLQGITSSSKEIEAKGREVNYGVHKLLLSLINCRNSRSPDRFHGRSLGALSGFRPTPEMREATARRLSLGVHLESTRQ